VICPACFGTGYRKLRSYPGNEAFDYPCDVCESRGVVYCCEGEECSNDPPVPMHQAFDIFDVRRPHVDGPDCWCDPTELHDGELLHWNVV